MNKRVTSMRDEEEVGAAIFNILDNVFQPTSNQYKAIKLKAVKGLEDDARAELIEPNVWHSSHSWLLLRRQSYAERLPALI